MKHVKQTKPSKILMRWENKAVDPCEATIQLNCTKCKIDVDEGSAKIVALEFLENNMILLEVSFQHSSTHEMILLHSVIFGTCALENQGSIQ